MNISINTAREVRPVIYAYTTPEIARHQGWTKIGYTEQDVDTRIKQQTHTAGVQYHLEWTGDAFFDGEPREKFSDKDFHAYLRKTGVENERATEWFHITGPDSQEKFGEFRASRGILRAEGAVIPYTLREEQDQAVRQALDYMRTHEKGEFLWNAKPRFGKTLAVYDFCRRAGAKTVLIVTNRPAIANSWLSDYLRFMGEESGFLFVSEVDALRERPGVLSREEYTRRILDPSSPKGCFEFLSLQDLKGSVYFGGRHKKLKEVRDITWDVLVIDEAHEGVDTYRTDVAFDQISRRFTLHLSGTPFKALANNKFHEDAIFNWTYADEQAKKRDWDPGTDEENPYADLPRLNLYTYQMSEIIREELEQGIEINGETEEYAFDLNEFFAVREGRFVHEDSVDKFLDALTTQEKFPFSTAALREELKHTFWLLNRVDSARALANKLKKHPVFRDYEVVLAAGDGRIDDEDENKKSYDRVVEAIREHDRTITLSVGQLTTGITVPEWTAVLMLSSVKSPALYMQAAFRAQNPCLFQRGAVCERKENAYVFDFDPARTLTIFEEFANDLSARTASGRGDLETRKENIRTLLNFFPVVGEDKEGKLTLLDAEKVLTIPRKIRSQEVVHRGFMSDFLFQNISRVFGAPQEVIDILSTLPAVEEPKARVNLPPEANLPLDEEGNVSLPEEVVLGTAADVFGDKIYGTVEQIGDVIGDIVKVDSRPLSVGDPLKEQLKTLLREKAVKGIVDAAEAHYTDMRPSERRQMESRLKGESDRLVNKTLDSYSIERDIIEQERAEALKNPEDRSASEVNQEYDQRQREAADRLHEELKAAVDDFVASSTQDVVRTIETGKKEREKRTIEDGIRDHLRGFSRTIPSFLMAYGDSRVTLATFDAVIPDDVFKEVTGITLDQFRFLRDGGPYRDEATGEERQFEGKLFDPVVFDDSIEEFLRLKRELANYFDERAAEDIFDYIPPQRTNQIFTPKRVVRKMVDMLEAENPGCFDRPDGTFIDLYMKSGLYITEIVRRLYQSQEMKRLFPDKGDRLRHIFEKQVYGLAPTEIIYRIATNYILGFGRDVRIEKHNFHQADALPHVKEGTLSQLLDDLY